jgi:IclR family KDG regulon transcriptional repressor
MQATAIDRSGTSGALGWSARSPNEPRKIKSAERTLALFELFSLGQRPLTVSEIARGIDMPQPSASMLVRNLSDLGYLEHDRLQRTYVPTMRIMFVGNWISRKCNREQEIHNQLISLAHEFGETAMVGMQNEASCQYVFVQSPDMSSQLEVKSSPLRPITATAAGRTLLSPKEDRDIISLVRRCNAEVEEPRLRIEPSQFLDIIGSIRKYGYSRTDGNGGSYHSEIAISLSNPIGKSPMAIALGGPIDRIAPKADQIVSALRTLKANVESPAFSI